jgi:hypothetical protein
VGRLEAGVHDCRVGMRPSDGQCERARRSSMYARGNAIESDDARSSANSAQSQIGAYFCMTFDGRIGVVVLQRGALLAMARRRQKAWARRLSWQYNCLPPRSAVLAANRVAPEKCAAPVTSDPPDLRLGRSLLRQLSASPHAVTLDINDTVDVVHGLTVGVKAMMERRG